MGKRTKCWKKAVAVMLFGALLGLAGCQSEAEPQPEEEVEEVIQEEKESGEEISQGEQGEAEEDGAAEGEAGDEGAQDVARDEKNGFASEDVPASGTDGGAPVPDFTDPNSILVLVNKERPLPAGYEPTDLVEPDVPFSFAEKHEKRLMRREAARALEELFAASQKEGLSLYAVSGYRSYERQKAIFAYNASRYGEEQANQFSARPGESEHQTGLAMDVSSPAVQFDLVEEFGQTPEGRWLAEHAAQFGFIIRYPEDKTHITRYQYEPWHLRYVGKEAAQEMAARNLTLEEYVQLFLDQ